jgi:hypothetical protein
MFWSEDGSIIGEPKYAALLISTYTKTGVIDDTLLTPCVPM